MRPGESSSISTPPFLNPRRRAAMHRPGELARGAGEPLWDICQVVTGRRGEGKGSGAVSRQSDCTKFQGYSSPNPARENRIFCWSYIVVHPSYLVNGKWFWWSYDNNAQRPSIPYVRIIHGSTTQFLDHSTSDLLILPYGAPQLRQYWFPKPFKPVVFSSHMCSDRRLRRH